jgi:hypothetical protein
VLAVADLKTLSQKEVARVFFDLSSHKTLDSGVGVLASST